MAMNFKSILTVIFVVVCFQFFKCDEEKQEMSVDGKNIMTPSKFNAKFELPNRFKLINVEKPSA
jgi:hypothetical protein